MFDIMNRKLQTRISFGRTGHQLITICTANGAPSYGFYTLELPPCILYCHLTNQCAVLCTVYDLSEGFGPKEDPYLHLPVLSFLYS